MPHTALHIVYATDTRYLLPTRVAASSAVFYASRPNELVIDILDCDIPDAEWNRFEQDMRRTLGKAFGLVRYKINTAAYASFKTWHTSRGIYARLSIPDILPADVDWCIYADGDTLFTADPFELVPLFDAEAALLGHIDEPDNEVMEKWYTTHGFLWNASTYICAGFICMNLEWFRKNELVQRSFQMLQDYPDIPFNDQDVLNILCQGHTKRLPSGWGVFANNAIWKETPKCIHYVGERPWEYAYCFPIFLAETTRIWFRTAVCAAKLQLVDINNGSSLKYFLALVKAKIAKLVFCLLLGCEMQRYRYALNRFKKLEK